MAMKAQQAAELINKGDFSDIDALYNALSSSGEHGAQFTTLLEHIEKRANQDIARYSALGSAALAIEKLDSEINPLDEKEYAFGDMRRKLDNVELTTVVNVGGKDVVKVVDGKKREEMIAQLVSAAKLDVKDELRGMSNPESPAAQRFREASNDDIRMIEYEKALNEKIDLAILQSLLASVTVQIEKEMQETHPKDAKKASEEAKKLLAKRTDELKQKVSSLSSSISEKVSVGVEGVIGYCADISVRSNEHVNEYNNNLKKIEKRIDSDLSRLKTKTSEILKNKWNTTREASGKILQGCNQKMVQGINKFNEGCKTVWENKYEIALNVRKSISKNKYEIGSDMVAAAGFAVAVGTGGTAALVGGAAYAAYTIGRRVVYEAYKHKKESPNKSYKEIYSNPKFLTKAAFSVGAAAISLGIASTAASAGADVATQTAAEIAKQLAAQKIAKRAVTMMGSVTSNIVGVATAKDADERSKEWKSLGLSVVAGGVTMLVAEACSGNEHPNTSAHTDEVSQDTIATQQPEATVEQPEATTEQPEATAEQPEATTEQPAVEDVVEMKEFPDQWNSDMGISRRQFVTLKDWYENLDTTEGAGMDRFYSHAVHYAAELSVNSENPMTAEQVLMKFSRLVAITSVKNGEYGTIGTGSLGSQMENLYHLLGCGDKLTVEQMEEARKTLDICTLNEAGRADGRMDAQKFFAIAGAGYKGLPVDQDGTLRMTNNIRVVGEGTDCPGDKRVRYEAVSGVEKKIVTPPAPPAPTPTPTTVVTEANSGEDTKLKLADDGDGNGDEVLTRAPDPAPEKPVVTKDPVVGARSNLSENPGREGGTAASNLTEGNPDTKLTGRQAREAAKMIKEIKKTGRNI